MIISEKKGSRPKGEVLILGIDPGTATTGWAVVRCQMSDVRCQFELVCYDCISTSKDLEMPLRLFILQKELVGVILRHKPDIVCVEKLFFGINARTAMSVGQARGVVLATAASKKLPVFEYQGLSVKHLICGHGRADKKEMEKGVLAILGKRKFEKPKSGYLDDAVDAIAIAIFHFLKEAGDISNK